MTTRDMTVWDLAEATGQPLEIVIFQAVAYEAWTPGGVIGADWASALTGVLNSSQPWRRQTHHHATEPPAYADQALPATPSEPDSGEAPAEAAFAQTVLGSLGSPVAIVDPGLCERLCGCGLGEMIDAGFVGFAEEATTWSQLASGAVTVEELGTR